jgi:hypothetical protein
LWNWTNHIAGDVLDHCNEELGLLMESGRHVRGRLDQLQDGYRPAWLSTPVIAVSSFLGHDTPDPELDGFYVFAADADAFLRCVRNIRGGGGEADAETLVRRVMSKLGIDADAKGGAS